ncbi:MAG: DUF6714 family protein [Limisphaerales bacterium]
MPSDEVRTQIEGAFADTPAPGDGFDDISASMDDEGLVDYFRGTSWHGHRVQDLRYHDVALSLFTDKAFRYWLPAFMLAELDHPVEADVIADSIAFHLTDSRFGDARLRQFAQEELEAIATFLNECVQRYDTTDFREAEQAVRARIHKA